MRAAAVWLGILLLAASSADAAVNCGNEKAVGLVPLFADNGAGKPGTFANPWINRHHVYCGNINRRGKAVGFHYREDGRDPVTGEGNNNPSAARITGKIKPDEGASGWRTYRGDDIEIWDNRRGRYVLKRGFSTFFPDNCTPADVLGSIRFAVANSRKPLPKKGGRFRGMSGPRSVADGYCYIRTDASGKRQPFAVTGFLNNLRHSGWTINTAYPQ